MLVIVHNVTVSVDESVLPKDYLNLLVKHGFNATLVKALFDYGAIGLTNFEEMYETTKVVVENGSAKVYRKTPYNAPGR